MRLPETATGAGIRAIPHRADRNTAGDGHRADRGEAVSQSSARRTWSDALTVKM